MRLDESRFASLADPLLDRIADAVEDAMDDAEAEVHALLRADRLLTLATPHQGSALARIGIGKNAREMQPGSLWLRDMASETIKIPFVSLRNAYDNYVMPQDTQRLPDARDIELPPVGHLAMLYDRQVADLLIACCDEGKNTP